MTKRVQRYRVTDTVMATLVGLVGELIVNLTNNSVHVHDGVTEGGFELGLANVSNVQPATVSQDGKMTTAHVDQLDQASAAIITLDAALDQEIIARAAGDTTNANAITALQGRATNLELGRFARNTEPVLLSFYQSTIPTGWTLNTSFDDRVPIVDSTQAQGGSTGGSWTISGLTADSHTHNYTPSGTNSSVGAGPTAAAGGAAFTVVTSGHTHTFSGLNANTSAASATGVTHTPSWRPNYVKVLVLSRSSWSA